MAGSYNHATNEDGELLNVENFVQVIENQGDAYETIEEMYGMIWWLGRKLADEVDATPDELVEEARENYSVGVQSFSPGVEE